MIDIALQVWIPCVKDLSNQGLSNPTITSSGATYNASGKLGGCYNIPSGYITGTYEAKVNMTFACWVYFNSTVTGHVFDARNTSTGKGYQPFCITSSTQIQAGNSTNGFPYFAHSMKTGIWYHLCVTHDADECRFYINGSLVGSTTSGRGADIGTCNFHVGSRFSSENYSNIKVNDIRIYDSTLSPNEIEILSRGLVVHYPLSDKYIESTSNLIAIQYQSAGAVSGWGGHTGQRTVVDASNFPIPCNTCNKIAITYSGSSGGGLGQAIQTISCTPSSTYSYSCYIRTPDKLSPLNGNILYRYEYKSDGTQVTEAGCWVSANTQELGDNWYRIWGTFTVSSSTVSFRVHNFFYPNKTCDYYIGCWQLELKNHVTPYVFGSRSEDVIYDVSGYNYHGTKVGTLTYDSDTPRYSTSTSFNGVDDCIQVPLNTFFPNAGSFTINLWFKKHELGSKNYETVFGGISGFEMDTRNGGNTTLSYYVTGNNRGFTIQSPLNFDTWYMLTMVCDGTNELYYLNGEYKKQFEKKGMPTGNYFIGAWRDSVSQNFKGLISDVRVYATALSATQIAELYNTAVSISNNGVLMGYELVES